MGAGPAMGAANVVDPYAFCPVAIKAYLGVDSNFAAECSIRQAKLCEKE